MKKILLMVALLFMIGYTADAQRFGIKGGLNFNNLKAIEGSAADTYENRTGSHIGIMYQAKIPVIGLAIQPELLYMRTGAKNSGDGIYTDNLVLPVNLQLGLDLIMVRPYILVAPYLTYALGKGDEFADATWDDVNRFNYGIGAGVGLDIWKLQITGKYNWDMGPLTKNDYMEGGFENAKLKGFQLSVGFFF
jgi:hypothetical protein